MRGVLLETGNISETIVAKMVIVSIIATPAKQPLWFFFPAKFIGLLKPTLLGHNALISSLKVCNSWAQIPSHYKQSYYHLFYCQCLTVRAQMFTGEVLVELALVLWVILTELTAEVSAHVLDILTDVPSEEVLVRNMC